MPIFEFKCTKCEEFIEVLVMGSSNDEDEIRCPKCDSQSFERVLSVTSHNIKEGGSSKSSSSQGSSFTQTRSCSSGSCTTYTVPGN